MNNKDFVIENGTLVKYTGKKWYGYNDITIPDGVTHIADNVFSGSSVSFVTLPEGLISIGNGAFYSCKSLRKINLPGSLKHIGDYAFSFCIYLSEMILPDGLEYLGESAFYSCDGLKKINIPSSLDNIGKEAFSFCLGLADQNGMVIVRDCLYSYYGTDSVVSIPEGVKRIEKEAFGNFKKANESITDVKLPKSLATIEEGAFYRCKGLADQNGFVIVQDCVYGYFGGDEKVVVPEGVKEISYEAFSSSKSLISVHLPASLEAIGSMAFSWCEKLKEINIRESVKIQMDSFRNCPGLANEQGMVIIRNNLFGYYGNESSVIIPDGVTAICESAFEKCETLIEVALPKGIKTIGDKAFSECSNLVRVSLPEGIEEIGLEAFEKCSRLEEISIPGSVRKLGAAVFTECSNLKKAHLGKSLVTIEKYTFNQCSSLKTVELPETLISIENHAFDGCGKLEEISLPKHLKLIGDCAFESTKLKCVSLPDGLESIGDSAFESCESLTTINLPSFLVSTGDSAFSNCISLKKIIIPEKVVRISNYMFSYCSNLQEVSMHDHISQIGEKAFYHCDCLENISLPKHLAYIGESAFCNCLNLRTITVPEGVTDIGQYAFNNCRDLISISLPKSLKNLEYGYDGPFDGCVNLQEIILLNKKIEIAENFFGGRFPKGLNDKVQVLYGRMKDNALKQYIIKTEVWNKLPPAVQAEIFLNRQSKTLLKAYIQCMEKDQLPAMCQEILRLLKNDPSAKMCNTAAEFMGATYKTIPAEQLKFIYEALKDAGSGAKALGIIKDNIPLTEILSSNSAEKRHPVEKLVLEYISNHPLEENAVKAVKQGMPYAGEKALSSKDAVAVILTEYMHEMDEKAITVTSDRGFSVKMIKDGTKLCRRPEADQIAAMLDQKALVQFLESFMDKTTYRAYLIAWARYATNESIARYTQAYKIMESSSDPKDKYKAENIREALLISDAKEVMYFYNRIGNLERYAKSHGKTVSDCLDEIVRSFAQDGVRYTGSDEKCSLEELISLVKAYDAQNQYVIHKDDKADAFAEKLDQTDLSHTLTELCRKSNETLVFCWGRYAVDKDIESMRISDRLYRALLLNDHRAAANLYEKQDDLYKYASFRKKSQLEIRDTIMLPSFGIDPDGIKRYDIGDRVIEVSITPDLDFRIFDTAAGKELRSFPKKSNDSAKAEACAKDFAEFKETVLSFAKQRSEIIHKLHMSGEYHDPELWHTVYVDHPIIRLLTQLVVWQDKSGATFIVTDGHTVNAAGEEIIPQGKIRVAHVLDMSREEIVAWQQALVRTGRKQLFEQIWEPIVPWKEDGIITKFEDGSFSQRYKGAVLTSAERNALKKALKLRGVDVRSEEMRKEYNQRTGRYEFSNESAMRFGDCLRVSYSVDEKTKELTFEKAISLTMPGNREMNAVLFEFDKAVLLHMINKDNDTALTDQALSVFTAAQIASLLNTAIEKKSEKCTALLLNYKNEHFPEYADVNEFSLDW